MNIDSFDYYLPEKLIAVHPRKERSSSRLLILDRYNGEIIHERFSNFVNYINDGDLIVYNDTKVIPARLLLRKDTGGKIEVLLNNPISSKRWSAMFHSSRPPKIGSYILNNDERVFEVVDIKEYLLILDFLGDDLNGFLENVGKVPLPPYILKKRDGVIYPEDRDFYQTVFAKRDGAVAAPTAGIHFDKKIITRIKKKGVSMVPITLHVGMGTFHPIKVNDFKKHKMHSEWVEISESTAETINRAKAENKKIIAIGTTTVRALEGVVEKKRELSRFSGDVNIFIYPGFEFKVVDKMVTNFHLPKSTLLLMVSAFAGRENILNAYNEAIKKEYGFYSYGDAMFIK